MKAFQKFTALFNVIEKEIPYSDDYNDHAGYFKPLVHENLPLLVGESAKLTTPTGKKVIVVRTAKYLNVVIFQHLPQQPLVMCSHDLSMSAELDHDMWGPLNNKTFTYLIDFLATEIPF